MRCASVSLCTRFWVPNAIPFAKACFETIRPSMLNKAVYDLVS